MPQDHPFREPQRKTPRSGDGCLECGKSLDAHKPTPVVIEHGDRIYKFRSITEAREARFLVGA
jgi:hypothetical protein